MTYVTSTPMNAPRKYNTIKTDAQDYLLVILSHYSSKSDGSCLMCLPSIAIPWTPTRMRLQVRLALISVAPVHDHLNPRPMAREAATARETAHCRGHDDHEGHGTGRGGLLRRRTRHGAATGGRHSRAGTRRRPPPVLRPS